MCALVLFHVVFARECFATCGAVDVLLARVLLPVPGGVAGCGKGVGAVEGLGVRAGVFLFHRRGWRCGGRCGVGGGGGDGAGVVG